MIVVAVILGSFSRTGLDEDNEEERTSRVSIIFLLKHEKKQHVHTTSIKKKVQNFFDVEIFLVQFCGVSFSPATFAFEQAKKGKNARNQNALTWFARNSVYKRNRKDGDDRIVTNVLSENESKERAFKRTF